MNYYKPIPCDYIAHQLTTENFDELAHMCGGLIRNKKLPVHYRELEIFTADADYIAEVGDYIVYNVDLDTYSVCSAEDFPKLFEKVAQATHGA